MLWHGLVLHSFLWQIIFHFIYQFIDLWVVSTFSSIVNSATLNVCVPGFFSLV